jgi:hypothetical protein
MRLEVSSTSSSVNTRRLPDLGASAAGTVSPQLSSQLPRCVTTWYIRFMKHFRKLLFDLFRAFTFQTKHVSNQNYSGLKSQHLRAFKQLTVVYSPSG